MLVDRPNNRIVRLTRSGTYNIQPETLLTLDGLGLVPLAIRTGEIIYVPDVQLEPNYIPSEARTRSELVIPLKTPQEIIAALDLQRTETDGFSESDRRLLTAYAERAASALENVRLYEQINDYAETLEQRVDQRTAELEHIKNRLEAIFDYSGDGILLLDTHYRIEQANHRFNELFV